MTEQLYLSLNTPAIVFSLNESTFNGTLVHDHLFSNKKWQTRTLICPRWAINN